METQFFGITFELTDRVDAKRCDWCGRIVPILYVEDHVRVKHPQVELGHIRVEPGVVIG